METIAVELRQFVVDNYLFGRAGDLSYDSSFLESGIVNSTGMLELIAFVEQTYAIQVEDSELLPENLDTISKLAKFVRTKQRMAKSAN
jgi:acyl carrier protein